MKLAAMTLAELYAPIATELEEARSQFDEELRSRHVFVNRLCEQVKGYRGKMLRPALLLLSGKATGTLTPAHRTLAAVVEMVHVATLVHDDVLDGADVRRRRSTVNAMSGNEAAVMLGDFLISHAFHLCSSLDTQYASREIGATTNTVCEGELNQIHHRGDSELTEPQYLEIIGGKTAALTATCCALGTRFAGAPQATVERMRRFGTDLGVAFQIVDDVLDLTGSEDVVGKTLGRDLDLGKPTLPVIHAISTGDGEIRRWFESLIRDAGPRGRDGVQTLLRRTGSTDYALGVARDYAHRAVEALRGLPESPARASLAAMAAFVVDRAC
jgi:octaprenyl-diphosphate synthase